MTTQTFGAVTAVAPASMTVFNDHPTPPDLSGNLMPSDAFKQLAASLSDSQWAKLTSAGGIGPSDLDGSQQALYWAIFPGRTLKIAPEAAERDSDAPIQTTDLTADLPNAHIRVALRVALHARRQSGGNMSIPDSPPPDAPLKWAVASASKPPSDTIDGSLARAVIANAPKAGDLKFDQAAFKTQVSLPGIKTVGELVRRIGLAAKLELYADRHYEARPVAFLGPDQSASAGDLLQALAFCVTGTYRAVGPAYVLTDNLTGMGALRQIWANREAQATLAEAAARIKTQETLYARHNGDVIPSFGDPLAQSQEQAALNSKDLKVRFYLWSAWINGIPFASLTSSQQDAARRMVARYNTTHVAAIAKDPEFALNLNGKWQVEPKIEAQHIAPGFPQPIEMPDIVAGTLLMPPPEKLLQSNDALHKLLKEQRTAPGAKPPPPLASLLKQTAHRAALAAPSSASEVKALVAAMRKLGLNELWLSVFSNGQAHIPGTPFVQPLDEKDDILSAALAATKGTGITVFPAAGLLTWGVSSPEQARDIDVLGADSIQAGGAAPAQPTASVGANHSQKPSAGMWVSRFSPEVRTNVAELISALAKPPGIGGLVRRFTTPPGYSGDDMTAMFEGVVFSNDAFRHTVMIQSLPPDLGYASPVRLEFLRIYHAGPPDIRGNSDIQANLQLSSWDSGNIDSEETKEWDKYRKDAQNRLLRSLLQAVRLTAPSGVTPSIFFQQSNRFGLVRTSNYEGGPIRPEPWPTNGDLPDPKPDLNLATILLKPNDDAVDLATGLTRIFASKGCDGFALDTLPADGGAVAAGLENLADKTRLPVAVGEADP